LWADVEALEHEPHRDLDALRALGRWMMRFTPMVEVVGESTGPMQPAGTASIRSNRDPRNVAARVGRFTQGERIRFEGVASHPRNQLRARPVRAEPWRQSHAILLDLTGVAHLFGGAERLLDTLAWSMQRLGLTFHLGSGPTVGAAWAETYSPRRHGDAERGEQTKTSKDGQIARRSEKRTSPGMVPTTSSLDLCGSAALPLSALRLAPDTLATLHHLGVNTVGALRQLPRDQLPARLGDEVLLRLDQLDGVLPEPITPVELIHPVGVLREWDFAVESLELLVPVIEQLLVKLESQLARLNRGVRELRLTLPRSTGRSVVRVVRLASASRDPARLMRLIRASLESSRQPVPRKQRRPRIDAHHIHVDSKDAHIREGYTGVRIDVVRSEITHDRQTSLIERDEPDTDAKLADLLESLAARCGAGSVVRALPAASHLPERQWDEQTPLEPTASTKPPVSDATRPPPSLGLFRSGTTELRVTVSPSHDRDGRPVQITWPDGATNRIVHAMGPDRVAGEWWRGHDKTRDYFDAEDDTGRRLWLVRVCESNRWFLAGEYA
jgi:protein ImuB